MERQVTRAMLLALALGASALWIMCTYVRTDPASSSDFSGLDLDPAYATAAFCGNSPLKGGDAQLIADWGKAHHIHCGVN
jgi:hypothetical protein